MSVEEGRKGSVDGEEEGPVKGEGSGEKGLNVWIMRARTCVGGQAVGLSWVGSSGFGDVRGAVCVCGVNAR